ncbi:MAG: hypothetical protein WBC53_11415 [Phycisphaerae bacterium]
MRIRCPKCGAEWDTKGRIGFRDECPECAAYLHTCINCRHFDAATGGCRIPTTDPVHDRRGQNFCEEFEFGVGSPEAEAEAEAEAEERPSAEAARRQFENLFRDSDT